MSEAIANLDSPVTMSGESSTPSKEYLHPYWSNKDNRHLIVTIRHSNGKENIASIMDPDGTNPDMKAVLEQFTEDEIDANTQKGLERRNENIKRQMERRESQAARAKQESLFNAKLQAFEIELVKNSKDTEMKKAIRKSKNIMEVQAYATLLMMKELENAKEKETD